MQTSNLRERPVFGEQGLLNLKDVMKAAPKVPMTERDATSGQVRFLLNEKLPRYAGSQNRHLVKIGSVTFYSCVALQ